MLKKHHFPRYTIYKKAKIQKKVETIKINF